MDYKQINTDVFLNKITSQDQMFAGDFTCDPYQNCEYGCLYCDSSFEKTIYVKKNADEILKKEIKNIAEKILIIGSVHDPYQKAEEQFKITQKILKIVKNHGLSCHILTKSDLILRDLNLILDITQCTVTFSLTSLDNFIVNIFEKNVPSPDNRLNTMKILSENGIKTGVALIPILPFIIDNNDVENIIKTAKQQKAQYILYKHLELKGDQKKVFLKTIKTFFPDILKKYEKLYKDSYMPNSDYISKINTNLKVLCKKYQIKNKI